MTTDSYIAKRMNAQIGGGAVALSAACALPVLHYLTGLLLQIATLIVVNVWNHCVVIRRNASMLGGYLPDLTHRIAFWVIIGTIVFYWRLDEWERDHSPIHPVILLVTSFILIAVGQWKETMKRFGHLGMSSTWHAASWSAAYVGMLLSLGAIVYGVFHWWGEIGSATDYVFEVLSSSELVKALLSPVVAFLKYEVTGVLWWLRTALVVVAAFSMSVLLLAGIVFVPVVFLIQVWICVGMRKPVITFFQKDPRAAMNLLMKEGKGKVSFSQVDFERFTRFGEKVYFAKARAFALSSVVRTAFKLTFTGIFLYTALILLMKSWHWF